MLLAGLALVRASNFLSSSGAPLWLATLLGLMFAGAIMVACAWLIERLVLRQLIDRDGLTLFMATIGVTFTMEGASQLVFGSDVYPLRFYPTDFLVPVRRRVSRRCSGQQARCVGRPDRRIAGCTACGLLQPYRGGSRAQGGRGRPCCGAIHRHTNRLDPGSWCGPQRGSLPWSRQRFGERSFEVQYSITFLALKALPVLIIGGFTSIPGAIIGGLIVGAGEKLAEVFLGPQIGGGIEYWFAYVVALFVLLVRPQGLFGERHIARI